MDLKSIKSIPTRREFLQQSGWGLGTIALWNLLAREGRAGVPAEGLPSVNPLAPKAPHFNPTAKNVILLFMAGGPSHLDLFDPKPGMNKWEGKPLPESMRKAIDVAFVKPTANVWASPRSFKPHGECGMELSDLLPHSAKRVDDICLIRSMFTEQVNHHPAQLMMSCGSGLGGRPAMGSWVTYGLGSTSENLPGFVVLSSGGGTSAGSGTWTSGFLPSGYDGVPMRSQGDPVLHLSNPPGLSRQEQRARLDVLRELNEQRYLRTGDREIAARIASYELAFRMQASCPELLDFSKESSRTLERYGVKNELSGPFATNCLLARRMVERGVRFVQVLHNGWDHHGKLNAGIEKLCGVTDQATGALLKDLKERGLLESTLVIWGGEFGRTPIVENRSGDKDGMGRDHHRLAFSMWMAGGGIKGGQVIGKTDDLGFAILEDKVHVHDLHATILHCLGMNHTQLTYRHQGREFRLTDVAGEVVQKALA